MNQVFQRMISSEITFTELDNLFRNEPVYKHIDEWRKIYYNNNYLTHDENCYLKLNLTRIIRRVSGNENNGLPYVYHIEDANDPRSIYYRGSFNFLKLNAFDPYFNSNIKNIAFVETEKVKELNKKTRYFNTLKERRSDLFDILIEKISEEQLVYDIIHDTITLEKSDL